jgi:hypothetical protein
MHHIQETVLDATTEFTRDQSKHPNQHATTELMQ